MSLIRAALVIAALALLGCEDDRVDLVPPPSSFMDAALTQDAPPPDAAPEL